MKKTSVTRLLLTLALTLGFSLSAMATDDFRVHRWESFHGLTPNQSNIVFVGNSITNMHDWWEAFGDNPNIINRGTSGGFTYEVLSHLESIIMGQPEKVFIGIGTNDLNTSATNEATAENIRIIAERIRRESPRTKVYVQSLLPSTWGSRSSRIPVLNDMIRPIVEQLNTRLGNVEYLDVHSQLVSSTNPLAFKTLNNLSLAYDNLHPTVLGYGLWCKYIESYVGSPSIYDTTATTLYNGNLSNSTGDRITCFAQQVVEADDVLFIGDEMVSSGEWHEWLKSKNIKNRGLGWGYTGSELNQEIINAPIYFQNSKSVAPKAIIIYAGVQEAHSSLAASNFKTRYQSLITALRNKAATSKIYLVSPLQTPNATVNGFIDSYQNVLAELAAENQNVKVIDATSMNGTEKYFYRGDGAKYFTSYGYAKMAQHIATAVNADFAGTFTAVTDAECENNNTLFAARTTLGNALTVALRTIGMVGDGVGQYTAANLSELNAKIDAAFAILQKTAPTASECENAAAELTNVTPLINKPLASTDADAHWYTLCSTNRDGYYLTSNGTNAIATTSTGEFTENQWKFVDRGNGTYNIINRQDNLYLTPADYNQALTMSSSAPSNGWTFSECNSAGMFNIANGTCEINVTSADVTGGKKVVNWSKEKNGADREDKGCQFTIKEFEGEPTIKPDTPEHGKVFVISNDHQGTPFYLNKNLTSNCTALSATASGNADQQWIVWGDNVNGYEIYNVANQSQKLTANSGVTTFDITNEHKNIGNTLLNHNGTNEHMAGNSFTLTLNGGKFTGAGKVYNEFVNGNDKWSTDFTFYATGQNAYRVKGGSVTIGGNTYTDGQFIVTESTISASNVTAAEGKTVSVSNNTITVTSATAPDYYTITNHQKSGTTYVLYINDNGELTIGGAGTPASTYGDAALFSKEEHNGKWTFKSKATDQYLVWRGNSEGYNNNKGVTPTYDATYCDFTPKAASASTNVAGGYYLVGKRSNGNDGSWVISSSGEWNKWGNSECWQDGYSNIFTIDLDSSESIEVSLAFKDGTISGGTGTYRSTWTSSSTPAVTATAYNNTSAVNNLPYAQASSDGFIVYTGNRNASGQSNVTPYVSYLRVSAPDGYYVTGYSFGLTSFDDLTATGVTVTTPKGSSYTVNNTSAAQSEEYNFTDDTHTFFDLNLTGENKGVKFTNFKVYIKKIEVVEEPAPAFEVSAEPTNGNFADDTHWYALHFVNGGYWIAGENNSVTVQGRAPFATNDAGLWAFTGDDTNGYTIYNKAKGASVCLSYASVGNGVAPTFAAPGTGNTTFALATSTASTKPQAYTFHFSSNCYINKYNGGSVVSTWNSTQGVNDNGSSILFEAAEDLVEDHYNTAYVFDNAASKVAYRIPAIAKNIDGDLIAVTDYRYSGQDIGMVNNGGLDLRYAIKDHTTGEWSEPQTLVAYGNWAQNAEGQYVPDANGVFTSFGDPCIVADRESNLVMVTSCCGNVSFPDGTHERHQGWSRFISEDGGKHWSTGYIDLSQQVFDQLDKRSDGNIKCFFIGSGKISQSRTIKKDKYYRLYCAALVKPGAGANVNYVFYSDDFGLTWTLLGTPDIPAFAGGDEPKADELPDGSVILSSRNGNGRTFNVFHYTNTLEGKGEWTTATYSTNTNSGTWGGGSNGCNGETMNVPVRNKQTGEKTFLLLQSTPRDNGRNNVSIYYKELTDLSKFRTGADIAPSWDGYLQLSNVSSAYSTMCVDKNNHVAFFFEENGAHMGYDMVYKDLTIEQITSDKYEYCVMTHADSVAYLQRAFEPYVSVIQARNFGSLVGQLTDNAQSIIAAAAQRYTSEPKTATYDAFNLALTTAPTRRINSAKTYHVVNAAYTGYAMGVNASGAYKGMAKNNADERQLIKFVPVNESDPTTFYILNPATGLYYGRLAGNETEAAPTANTAEAGQFKVNSSIDGRSNFFCINKSGSNSYIHLKSNYTQLVPWSATEASHWTILPVEEPLDITNDGLCNLDDITALEEIVAGKVSEGNNPAGYILPAADLNDDGLWTIGDVTTLIRLLLEAEEQ